MTNDEWIEWQEHHSALFQLNSEADLEMFRAWRPILQDHPFGDLIEASTWIARTKPETFRTQHAAMLSQRVAMRRVERYRLQQAGMDQQAEQDRCKLCRGVGILILPHPKHVEGGVWMSGCTAAITCDCRKGQAVFQARERMMSLTHYEAINRDWPAQLEARDRMILGRAHANGAAGRADRLYGKVIANLKKAIPVSPQPQGTPA